MNRTGAKDYLDNYRRAIRRIEATEREIEQVKSMRENVISLLGKELVDGTRTRSRLEEAVVRYDELLGSLEEEIREYHRVRQQVLSAIDMIADPLVHQVIHRRYVQFQKQIACQCDMTFRHVLRINDKGLEIIADAL